MKIIILLLGVTFCLPNLLNAQNRVAKIDSNQLFDEYPGKDKYLEELDELREEYQQELKDMVNKLSISVKKFNEEKDLQSIETNQKRVEYVQNENKKIDEFKKLAMDELYEEQTSINKKMRENIRSAVSNVAKKQNLDFVIDSSSKNNIINAGCKDIFNDVKKELINLIAEREESIKDILGGR